MKSLMLLLALGLATSDKLDRTYLPPPGSKIAGGSDGAIQVPLELPKEAYSTTGRPLAPGQKEDGFISVGDKQPIIGVGLPNIPLGSPDFVPVTSGSKTFFSDLQNKVPTTSTTYAFTQTTTFPPFKALETTVSAVGPTAFPPDVSHDIQNGVYTPSGQSQGYPQPSGPTYVPPGTQIVQSPGVLTPGTGQPPGYQTPAQNFVGRPGYNLPSIIQYLPGQTVSTTTSPITESPPVLTQPLLNQGFTQHLGVQPPRQFGQQVLSSSLAPQDVPQNYLPGPTPANYGNLFELPVPSEPISSQQIGGRRPQNLGQQNLQPTIQPGFQYVTDNRGNIVPILSSQELGGQRPLFGGQPGPTQPGISPQFINNVQRTPGSGLPQQLVGQQPVFNGQQAPFSPTSTIVPQPGSYPQYSNVLPGSNFSQPNVQALNQQQGLRRPFIDVPQYQVALNNQGGAIPGSTTPQVISPQAQFINQPGFTPATEPSSSPIGVFQPSVDQLGVIQPGLPIHTGYNPINSYQPGSTQSPITGNIPQTTIYPGLPAQIIPGKAGTFLQPTQGSFNQNNYQTTDRLFPLQQHPDRSGVQNIHGLDSTGPTSIAPPRYNQPSYSSTTPGATPGSFSSTTLSPIRTTSSTPYSLPGPADIIQGKILRPERPQAEFDKNAEILNYKNILTPDGEFEYSFDTSNGIHADENGTSIDGVKADGSYSYIGDDGKLYSVVYSADENGFRPQGAHLPTPPPIPDAIQKVIEQAAKDMEDGISHDGFYDEDKYGYKKYQNPNRIRPQQQDKFINNGADIPDKYYEVRRPGQTKPGEVNPGQVRPELIREGQVIPDRVRPGQFKSGTKGDESQSHRNPNTATGVDEYDEYISQIGEHDNSGVKIPSNQVSSKLPLDKQQNKYIHNEDRPVISNKKPLLTDLREDNKGRYLPGVTESFSPHHTIPGKKPSNKPGLSKNGYVTEDKDINENDDIIEDYEKDRRLPSSRPEIKYYDQDEQKLPGKFNQQYTVTGRPVGPKRPVSMYNDEDELTSQPEVYQVKQPGRRPLKPSPENDVPESDIISGKPQGSRRPVSQSSKYYPGQTLKPGQPDLPHYDTADDNEGKIYDQDVLGQPYDQRKEYIKSKYPLQSGNKDTGYQYLPPQHQFQENGSIPTGQSSEVTLGSDTRRPVTKGDNDEKRINQPFKNADVYRDEGTFYENTDNVASSRKPNTKPGRPATTSPDEYASTKGPSYNEKENEGMISQPQYGDKYSNDESIRQETRPGDGVSRYPKPSGQPRPGQVYSEERVEGSKIPYYIMSSTTPTPSRGRGPTKGRPQYEQTYDPSFPSSTAIPGMRIPGRPRPEYDETTIPGSSTVTPGQTDISRPSSRLPYQYRDRTTPAVSRISSNRPGQRLNDYSTTPKTETYRPGFTSGSDRIYIDQTQPGYTPDNFETTRRPTTYYPDTIAPGSDIIRPGTNIPSRPGIQNVPSTTYRPNYTIIDETTGKPINVDAFGIPVSKTYRPGYPVNQRPNTVQEPGTTGVQTTARVFRPNDPRFEQTSPPSFGSQRPGSQVSSTTEGIIGEDFSGPKQPQRFDPKTGYHY